MLALLLGIVIFCAGFLWWRKHKKFFKHAIVVPGAISSYTTYETTDKEGHTITMYRSVVSFEFDDKVRTVVHPVESGKKPEIGKPCQVGVDPYNIEEAWVYSKGEMAGIWLMIAVGVGLIVIGIATLCGKLQSI